MSLKRVIAALFAALLLMGQTGASAPVAMDPINPTCPASPNWTDIRTMQLTFVRRDGVNVLMAEGAIDAGLPDRLRAALAEHPDTEEVWLRSPGGNAVAGTEAGRVIRANTTVNGIPLVTRVPSGWTCFSACNFVFFGGMSRIVEPGGWFMVHMFTFTNDRGAIRYSVERGADATTELVGDVEQQAALLASEDNDFLLRMGIPRTLLTEVMYQQRAVASGANPAQRHCLSRDELARYRVHRVPSMSR
jgi:hypothetical protein